MPDLTPSASNNTPHSRQSELRSWGDTPTPPSAAKDIELIRLALHELGSTESPAGSRARTLDSLYTRCCSVSEELRPLLTTAPLPLPRRLRPTIRAMQDTLSDLADKLIDLSKIADTHEENKAHHTRYAVELVLWRVLDTLSRHLFIGSLTASPPISGIWRRLHETYTNARLRSCTNHTPEGTTRSLQDVYYAAVLLGCAQPASFTGAEIDFLEAYTERFSSQIDSNRNPPGSNPLMFWIDPARDTVATPCTRKPPPPETPVRFFSCSRLAALLAEQLASLNEGVSPEDLNLPAFAATPAGKGVLKRLIGFWGSPGKRRFPRRRQNYRGELCIGFDNLCRLYRTPSQPVDTSDWIITNESPDGYSVMHAAGKIRAITVGDVVSLKTETGDTWQACIIRWAISENQEHIELGLQVLSAQAFTADIAFLRGDDRRTGQPALVLPATPALRPEESLVVPSGLLSSHFKNIVLIEEKNNIEVREINIGQCDEQNGRVEIFEIATQAGEER